MRWKNSRTTRRTGAAILGVAVALPLLAIPGADAATSTADGNFLIKASDTKFFGIAGANSKAYSGGSATDPGTSPSNPSNPGGGSTTPANRTINFSCGPLNYTIDQPKLDFAAANQKLHDQGRDSEIKPNSEGWASIYSYNALAGSITPGVPDPLPYPTLIELSASMTPSPITNFVVVGSKEAKIRFTKADNGCRLVDVRKTPVAGDRFTYSSATSGSYTDGRYESRGGKLYATRVTDWSATSTGISMSFSRALASDAMTGSVLTDPTELYAVVYTPSNDEKTGWSAYPSVVDDYNRTAIHLKSDGTQWIEYRSVTTDGETSTDRSADRKQGPVRVSTDAAGKMTSIGYYDSAKDGISYIPAPYTVANYNAVTKQNWDGSYPKASSYDFSIPFTPLKSQ